MFQYLLSKLKLLLSQQNKSNFNKDSIPIDNWFLHAIYTHHILYLHNMGFQSISLMLFAEIDVCHLSTLYMLINGK